MCRDIPGADNADQMLPIRDLLVGKLVKQAGYMNRQPPVIDGQRTVA